MSKTSEAFPSLGQVIIGTLAPHITTEVDYESESLVSVQPGGRQQQQQQQQQKEEYLQQNPTYNLAVAEIEAEQEDD
eukprot:scaffold207998_cov53-Cyclotella_meneghiniana.AAC.1